MNRKTFISLFVGIAVFLAAYLYYVKVDRQQSIEKYFDDPRIGDIYKIKSNDSEGRPWVQYLKLTVRQDNKLIFKASKLQSNGSSDYLLRHFQENSTVTYSLKDLHEIRNGLWDNYTKDNTTLIEIIRKN